MTFTACSFLSFDLGILFDSTGTPSSSTRFTPRQTPSGRGMSTEGAKGEGTFRVAA